MSLNVLEWMYANGRQLAALIKEDGSMGGPKAAAMLLEVSKCTMLGKQRSQARALLKRYLISMDAGDLLIDEEAG